MNKKFELIKTDTKVIENITLYRIRALVKIPRFGINPGELGGYLENENNLADVGDAWVSGNARVFGDAWVFGDAQVYGNARVFGDAQVSGMFQLLSVIGLRWPLTIDTRAVSFGCQRKKLKDWTEEDAIKNGLTPQLYLEYRKLATQLKRIQRIERETDGQIKKKEK